MLDNKYLVSKFSSVKERYNYHIKNKMAKLYKYYFGEAEDIPVLQKRSKYVVKEVLRVVENVMPDLMRMFTSGVDYVTITPRGGAEDELAARLMHEKVNYDIMVENDGYKVIYDAIKDALLGYGVIKYSWEKKQKVYYRKYENLQPEEYVLLLNSLTGKNYEIISEKREEIVVNGISNVSVSAIIRIVEEYSAPTIIAVPPEDVIFDYTVADIQKLFIAHRVLMNVYEASSKLQIPVDILKRYVNVRTFDELTEIRDEKSTLYYNITDDDIVEVYECYYYTYDKNGNYIPIIFYIANNEVIKGPEINIYGRPPFCIASSIRMPHRLVGKSLAELAKDGQDLKTVLFRYMLDNIYFQNNGRYVVNPRAIVESDLINNNVPGGIIRTRDGASPSEAIMPIMPAPIAPQFFNIWNISDLQAQQEHGVGDYMQGLDSKTLNKTATGVTQILNRSLQRVELIGRTIAETLLKDLYSNLIELNINFMDKNVNIKIDNEWVNISPDDLKGKYGSYDVIIDVGASTGMREYKVNQMISLVNIMVNPLTLQLGVVDASKIANLYRAIIQTMGFKNLDMYVNDIDKWNKMNVNANNISQEDVEAVKQNIVNFLQGGLNEENI